MSKLIVEICKVKSIVDHSGADRLEILTVKGWNCIVPKGEFKKDDLVIFVPPDSLLTDSFVEEFDITYLKGKNNRISTIKLRGEWSEGLVLPNKHRLKEGKDVAELYKITKWEPKLVYSPGTKRSRRGDKHMQAKIRAYKDLFPKYTNIEHVRNFQTILEYGEEVWITEKIHGTNFRAGWVPLKGNIPYKLLMRMFGKSHKFLIGSRNVIYDDSQKDSTYYGQNVYAEVAKLYDLRNKLCLEDYIIYGEIFGTTNNGKVIQKGYSYGKNNLHVRFFDVSYKQEYLSPYDAYIFLHTLGLPTASILYQGPWDLKLINQYSIGMSKLDEWTLREGIVIRPIEERRNKRIGRVILKAVSPAYLAQKNRSEGH